MKRESGIVEGAPLECGERGTFPHDLTIPGGVIDGLAGRTALYRYFAVDDSLLYVGIAFDPEARGRQHSRTASDTWWHLAAKRTDEWFENRRDAELAELDAITYERPRFNVRDNPHTTEDVQRMQRVRAAKAERLPGSGSHAHWLRVAELIRSRIESGELPPKTKVSHAAYASEFGVSVDTVKRACRELADEGLLQRGHGYRVAPGPPSDRRWLLLSLNRPTEMAETLRKAMGDDQVRALMAAFVAASWRENPVVC